MKAILLLFDSLNRRFLPPYGCRDVKAPGFVRLAKRSTVFDNSYVASMPCIPARRDLHTGRCHFLHREWGPLEPFDQSVFSILDRNGIYSHLITDHYNYWEEGGGGYHTKYNSFEFVRGQEGDRWKGDAAGPRIPPVLKELKSHSGGGVSGSWKANWVNRQSLDEKRPETYPQHKVFSLAEEFLEKNADADNWVLQIESFSPHEPFLVPGCFRQQYEDSYRGPVYDWPRGKVEDYEDEEVIGHMRTLYKASISMADHYLNGLLDTMDRLDLWKDTMLIVGADHGILLGEHGYWSKNIMPYYDEIANTPLFIYDPRHPHPGERRKSLVQMIDWAPTLLDYYGIEVPEEMTGSSLAGVIDRDEPVRDCALFGVFSGHVNLVDRNYIYMRAARPGRENEVYNYTVLPLHMFKPFEEQEMQKAVPAPPFRFTRGCPLLKIPSRDLYHVSGFGDLLFDRRKDPGQDHPLEDKNAEARLCRKMERLMEQYEAPPEQFWRLGLKECGGELSEAVPAD